MIVNATTAAAANRNFRGVFVDSLRATAPTWYQQLFMVIQSDSPEETFSFLRGTPRMREWLGDRQIRGISEASFRIEKKDWEATISVLRDEIQYDRLNQVRPAIQQLAASFPQHYADFAVDLMLLGFTQNGYDGQYFFDTDHVNGDGTSWSNKTTDNFDLAAWQAAKLQAARLVEVGNNRPMRVRWSHLFYGSQAEAAVMNVFGSDRNTDGTLNVNYNAIPPENRILVEELGDTDKWFLFDLTKPIKPFILMIVKGVDFVALDSPDDWNVFNKKEFIYGIDSIDNAGYGLHELAYGSDASE